MDVQLETYKKHGPSLLVMDKTIKPHNDEIFDEIGKSLGMSAKAVHFAVSRHADEIFGHGNYECAESNTKEPIEDDLDYLVHDGDAINLVFNITDPKEQHYFDLIQSEIGNRKRISLRNGWTDALFHIITRETLSDCIFNFKRANIISREFSTSSECEECGGTVKVLSSNDRRGLNIEFKTGTREHSHKKLRRLTKAKTQLISSQLSKKSVDEVYLSQAEQIPIDAEHPPRNYVQRKSIANVKTKDNKQEDSAINSLRTMKYSVEMGDFIKEICTDPFSVIFWTKKQDYVYNEIAKKHWCSISIDATGSLIRSQSLITDISKKLDRTIDLPHVFLYLISVKMPGGKSTPVAQMLSSQQDSIKISYFCNG